MRVAATSAGPRRIAQGLLLLLLPVLTVVAAEHFRVARGSFFFAANQDPSYSYLIGSLRLAIHGETNFYHHPGLPTQGLAAAVCAAAHAAAGRQDDLTRDVLAHPEAYLRAIQLTNLAAVVSALAALGFLAWRRGGVTVALFFLITPFLCAQSLASLAQVGPEAALVLAAVALAFSIWWIATTAPADERAMAIALGIIAAFAITTRVSALPFVLIPPLILTTWRSRAFFAGTLAAGSGLALIPLLGYWERFSAWVFGLGRRTGGWGSKPRDLLDSDLYIEGFVKIYRHHHALFAVLALAISVWLWYRFRKGGVGNRRVFHRALGAVLIGQIALVLLVTKNPSSRYLVPATALAGLDLALVWTLLRNGAGLATGRRRFIVATLLLMLPILLELPRHRKERDRLRRGVEGQRVIAAEIAQLPPNCKVANYYRASSLPLALHFGHRIRPAIFREELAELYPQEVFYNYRRRGFENFAGRLSAAEVALQYPCIALRGHRRRDLEPLEVRRTAGESLYVVSSLHAVVAPEVGDSD